LRHAEAMVAAGASLIDVGGESTRPGALPVSAEQELQRVAPIVEAIAAELDVIISVDSSTPAVMLETARLGAGLLNDVRALRRDGALAAAAATGLPVCLMHMQGEPGNMQQNPSYESLIDEVCEFFTQRLAACVAAGIEADRLILDPGFGFAKNLQHNLSLFKHLQALHVFGRPLLVGVSRKSMIGQTLGREIDQRLAGSLALVALALAKGAKILRVHDVPETVDLVRMIAAVEAAE
jgi:dihydropteroate synthase